MSFSLCRKCGEEVHPGENPTAPDIHDDCYAIADMERLREVATCDDNPRHIVRLEHVASNRYQAVWSDLLPTVPIEKGEVVCL